MATICAYTLVTHGKKPMPGTLDHPAIRKQIANIRQALPGQDATSIRVAHDYARQIRSLDDLPVLMRVLTDMKSRNVGKLVIDDLSRLFRICPLDSRLAVLNSLEPFGAHLFDLRRLGLLSRAPFEGKTFLLKHADTMSGWEMPGVRKALSTAQTRAESTRPAREAS